MQALPITDHGVQPVGLILNYRLKTLRELATTLLSEVEEMARVRALDIKNGINIYDEVQRYEAELIRRALKLTGGHQVRAARLLGIKKTTLNSKIKRYKILHHDAVEMRASHADVPAEENRNSDSRQ